MSKQNKLFDYLDQSSSDKAIQDPSTTGVGGLNGLNTNQGEQAERTKYGTDFNGAIIPTNKQEYQNYAGSGFGLPNIEGDSGFDDPNYEPMSNSNMSTTPYDDMDAYERKAQGQSVEDKWANGLIKMGWTAARTIADSTVGFAAGIVESIHNNDSSYMFKNSVSTWLSEYGQRVENDFYPNYYTQEERDTPWYKTIFTANFMADGLIKNMGFTVGAAISGSWVSAAMKGMRASAFMVKYIGAAYSAYSEGKIEARHTYEELLDSSSQKDTEYFNKMMDQIISEDIEKNKPNYINALIPRNENGDPMMMIPNPESKEYQELMSKDVDRRNISKDMISETARQKIKALEEQQKIGLKVADKQASHAGTVNSILNTLFLTIPEARMFGRLFQGGYNTTRRVAKNVGGNVAKQGKKFVGEFTENGKKLWKEVGKDALSESIEEGSQGFTNEYAQTYYGSKVDSYYQNMINPKLESENKDQIDAVIEAGKNYWGNIDNYDEMFMGAMSAVMGFPMINSQRGRRQERKGRWLDWYGGILEHRSNVNEYNQQVKENVDYANKRVNEYNEYLDNLGNTDEAMNFLYNGNIQKAFNYVEDRALEEGDKLEFLNAQHSSLINDIVYFANIGKIDVLESMIEASLDHTDLNLKDIVTMTSELQKDGKYKGVYVDANGNPMNLTEEGKEKVKEKLTKNAEQIRAALKDYQEISQEIDTKSHRQLTNSELGEMIWMKSMMNNWTKRMNELSKTHSDFYKSTMTSIANLPHKSENIDITEEEQDDKTAIAKKIIERRLENADLISKKEYDSVMYFLKDLAEMPQDKLRNLAVMQPDYVEAVLKLLKDPRLKLDSEVLDQMQQDVVDMARMNTSLGEFSSRYKEYLRDPIAIEENRALLDELSDLKYQQIEQKKYEKYLNNATSFSNFLDIAMSIKDTNTVLDSMANKNNKYAKDAIKTIKVLQDRLGLLDKAIDEGRLDPINAEMVKKALINGLLSSESFEDFNNKDSKVFDLNKNEKLFDGIYLSEGNELEEKNRISDILKNFLQESNDLQEWVDGFKNRDKKQKNTVNKRIKELEKQIRKNTDAGRKKKLKADKKKKKGKEEDTEDTKKDTKKKDTKKEPDPEKPVNTEKDNEINGRLITSIWVNDKIVIATDEQLEAELNKLMDIVDKLSIINDLQADVLEHSDLAVYEEQQPILLSILSEYLNGKYTYNQVIDILMGNSKVFVGDPKKITPTEVIETNNKQNSETPVEKTIKENKEYLRDAIPELTYNQEGVLVPFKDVYPQYTEMWNYLRDNGAFDIVNKGQVKEGDTVKFMVDKVFNEKTGYFNIFMINKDNKIIGVLQESETYGEVLGLADLRKSIISQADKSTSDIVIAKEVTSINSVLNGKNEYTKQEKDLKDIDGINSSEIKISVMKNGNMSMPNTKERPGYLRDGANKDGRIYIQIPTARGSLTPSLVYIKNMSQVDFKSDAFKETSTYKELYKAFKELAEAEDADEVIKARELLSRYLYINNIKTNLRTTKKGTQFISVSRVETDNDGNEIYEIDSKTNKKIRKEKETDLIFKSNQVEGEVNENGVQNLVIEENDTGDIIESIIDAFIELEVSFQVNSKSVNTPGYNERLIDDGLLTSNMNSIEQKSAWFVANPIVKGKEKKVTPPKFKPSRKGKSNLTGNNFTVGDETYTVDRGNIYNSKGKLQLNPPNRQVILDMDWVYRTYGTNKNGFNMIDGVVSIPGTKRILDTNTAQYSKETLDSFSKRLEAKGNTRTSEDSLVQTLNSILENQKQIDKTKTDGQYYYITEEDGQEYIYGRVTQNIGNNFVLGAEQQAIKDELEELIYTIDANNFEERIKSISQKSGLSMDDLQEFNRANLSNKEKQRLSSLALDKALGVNWTKSTDAGTSVDGIIRDFFNNVDQSKIVKPDNISEFAFKSLLGTLNSIKKEINKRGQTFLTNNIVLYHKYDDGKGNVNRVAGEVDILAYDEAGEFYIYDVKTSKNSFYGNDESDSIIGDTITNGLSTTFVNGYGKKGPKTIKTNINGREIEIPNPSNRSSYEQYTMQLSAYRNLFLNQYGKDIKSMALMPFHLLFEDNVVKDINAQKGIRIKYNPEVLVEEDKSLQRKFYDVIIPKLHSKSKVSVNGEMSTTEISNTLTDRIQSMLDNEGNLPNAEQLKGSKQNEEQAIIDDFAKALKGSFLGGTTTPGNAPGRNASIKPVQTQSTPAPSISPSNSTKNNVSTNSSNKMNASQNSSLMERFMQVDTSTNPVKPIENLPSGVSPSALGAFAKNVMTQEEIDALNPNATRIDEVVDVPVQQPSAPEVSAEDLDTLKDLLGGGAKPKRRGKKRFSEVTTPANSIADLEREIKILESILPQHTTEEALKIVDSLIKIDSNGREAWGQFENGVITLSRQSISGTLYHEAFHAVSDMYLDSNEKLELYEWVLNNKGDMSYDKAQELLADMFQEYMLDRNPSGWLNKITSGFKRLYSIVSNWGKVKPITNQIFSRIYKGKYANSFKAPSSPTQNIVEEINGMVQALNNMAKLSYTYNEGIGQYKESILYVKDNMELLSNVFNRVKEVEQINDTNKVKQSDILGVLNNIKNTLTNNIRDYKDYLGDNPIKDVLDMENIIDYLDKTNIINNNINNIKYDQIDYLQALINSRQNNINSAFALLSPSKAKLVSNVIEQLTHAPVSLVDTAKSNSLQTILDSTVDTSYLMGTINNNNNLHTKSNFSTLETSLQNSIRESGISQEIFDNMTELEQEIVKQCINI